METTPLSEICMQVLGNHCKLRHIHGDPIILNWDQLQQLKNEAFGRGARAVEVFPPESDLVYDINMRHLFRIPEGILPTGLTGWDNLGDY